jgi:uncharacterized cofD-like protein
MMEQYTGDFLAAVDGLRTLLGCRGQVWPITVERASICAEYADGSASRGEVEVDALQAQGWPITRLWLDPPVTIHPRAAEIIRSLDAVIIGPGSFYTSLLPIFAVQGCREALAEMRGPVICITNLLTEGRGMAGFTAGHFAQRVAAAIGRPIDAVIFNVSAPAPDVLARYAAEHKAPLPLGALPDGCDLVEGEFWRGPIARHNRRRLRAAVWAVLAQRLLSTPAAATV